MIKKSITILTIIALLSGCSIKNDDSTAEKALKHTVNSPLYVLVAGGVLVGGVVNGVANVTGANDKAAKKEVKPSTEEKVADKPVNQEN